MSILILLVSFDTLLLIFIKNKLNMIFFRSENTCAGNNYLSSVYKFFTLSSCSVNPLIAFCGERILIRPPNPKTHE